MGIIEIILLIFICDIIQNIIRVFLKYFFNIDLGFGYFFWFPIFIFSCLGYLGNFLPFIRRTFWKIRVRYDFLKMYFIIRMFFRKLLLELKYSDDFNNLWEILGNFRYYSMLFLCFFVFVF